MNILSTLNKTHKRVFKNFEYVTDQKQYNKLEHWVTPEDVDNVVGDCEDFALACRKILRDENINSRLVFCVTEQGEGHLVLEANGWILDNRQRKVITRDKLQKQGYRWLKISGYEPGDPWYKL